MKGPIPVRLSASVPAFGAEGSLIVPGKGAMPPIQVSAKVNEERLLNMPR